MSRWIKQTTAGTTSIATTSTTDEYVVAAKAGKVTSIGITSLSGLAAHDTNYLTFTVTNLGLAAGGSAALLAATDANTTKITGGSAMTASVTRALTLTSTAADLTVAEGDLLRLRATSAATLAGAVTRPQWIVTIKTSQR